jgi:hypothetical protein
LTAESAAIICHIWPADCPKFALKAGASLITLLLEVNEEIPMPNSFVCESKMSAGSRREAALNWLALGLLLAAWNASDNDAGGTARRRPDALRQYDYVSVRAMQRMVSADH